MSTNADRRFKFLSKKKENPLYYKQIFQRKTNPEVNDSQASVGLNKIFKKVGKRTYQTYQNMAAMVLYENNTCYEQKKHVP